MSDSKNNYNNIFKKRWDMHENWGINPFSAPGGQNIIFSDNIGIVFKKMSWFVHSFLLKLAHDT